MPRPVDPLYTPTPRSDPQRALRRAPLSHARCADRSCQLDVVLEATVASFLYRCYERRPAEVAGGKRMALVEVSLRKICNALIADFGEVDMFAWSGAAWSMDD